MEEYGYVYKVSSYETPRHTISHTDMYFRDPEHTHWIFTHTTYNEKTHRNGDSSVQYIRVSKSSQVWASAISNSDLQNKKTNLDCTKNSPLLAQKTE